MTPLSLDTERDLAPEDVPTALSTYQVERTEDLVRQLADARAQVTALEADLQHAEQAIERSEKKLKGKDRYDRRMRRRKKS
jgi:hypothetical protein